MAFIFQSEPEQWDLRGLKEGDEVSRPLSRYRALMYPGALILLWMSRGTLLDKYGGLYGWGITTERPEKDDEGRLRIYLKCMERWDSGDKAPISAFKVLSLPTWYYHPLRVDFVGSNFLVSGQQLKELSNQVRKKFPDSQFMEAIRMDIEGETLYPDAFKPPKRLVAKE